MARPIASYNSPFGKGRTKEGFVEGASRSFVKSFKNPGINFFSSQNPPLPPFAKGEAQERGLSGKTGTGPERGDRSGEGLSPLFAVEGIERETIEWRGPSPRATLPLKRENERGICGGRFPFICQIIQEPRNQFLHSQNPPLPPFAKGEAQNTGTVRMWHSRPRLCPNRTSLCTVLSCRSQMERHRKIGAG